MCLKRENGFTTAEFASVTTLLAIILLMSCTGTGSMDAEKERETKVNLHSIQIALERYATDHNGEYPEYIMGGDLESWDSENGVIAISQAAEGQVPPLDPLIEMGYLASYPTNPFFDSTSALTTIVALTGSCAEEGFGDVRFGMNGNLMGNCLDDPRYLFNENGQATDYQYTMLADPEANIGVIRDEGPNSFYCMGGLDIQRYWWPGEFFYRSGGDFFISVPPDRVEGSEFRTIWGWQYFPVNKYILGAYGSQRTAGLDVIRITTRDGFAASEMPGADTGIIAGEYYQDHANPARSASHPDFSIQIKYSNPETMGGGEQGLMPQFPYYEAGTRAWMFGAPDGYKDGIILTLTSDGFEMDENGEVINVPED